jgi:hypothetical protein
VGSGAGCVQATLAGRACSVCPGPRWPYGRRKGHHHGPVKPRAALQIGAPLQHVYQRLRLFRAVAKHVCAQLCASPSVNSQGRTRR